MGIYRGSQSRDVLAITPGAKEAPREVSEAAPMAFWAGSILTSDGLIGMSGSRGGPAALLSPRP
jgi:hypothetical protein